MRRKPRERRGGEASTERDVAARGGRLARVVARLKSVAGTSAVGGIAYKGASAILTLAVFALASRAMSRESFGEFVILFNILSFSAVVASFGQDGVFTQFWNKYIGAGDHARARGLFIYCGSSVAACAATAAGLITCYFSIVESTPVVSLAAIALFMITQAVALVATAMCRAMSDYVRSDIPNEFVWRVFVLVSIIACLVGGVELRADYFLFAATLGSALSTAFQIVVMIRVMPEDTRRARGVVAVGELFRDSIAYLGAAATGTTTQYAEVIVIGAFLSPVEAGAYFAATRFANVFAMVSTGVSAYALNRIAKFYFERQVERLRALHRETMTIVAAGGLAMYAFVVIAGRPLLGLFGADYRSEYGTLVFLATGAFAMSLTGQAAMALLATGHQRRFTAYQVLNIVARMGCIVLGGRLGGSAGAAFGAMVSILPFAALLVAANRRLLRADPSVLCLLS
jgi:O-antigen/teichoic acid export membrane protein